MGVGWRQWLNIPAVVRTVEVLGNPSLATPHYSASRGVADIDFQGERGKRVFPPAGCHPPHTHTTTTTTHTRTCAYACCGTWVDHGSLSSVHCALSASLGAPRGLHLTPPPPPSPPPPHHHHPPSLCLIWRLAALKKAGIQGVVFDKDNCLTTPYADTLHPSLAGDPILLIHTCVFDRIMMRGACILRYAIATVAAHVHLNHIYRHTTPIRC